MDDKNEDKLLAKVSDLFIPVDRVYDNQSNFQWYPKI